MEMEAETEMVMDMEMEMVMEMMVEMVFLKLRRRVGGSYLHRKDSGH